MVSTKALLASIAVLLSSTISAAPTESKLVGRATTPPCGYEQADSILSPQPNTTIIWTADEQANDSPTTFEIIYCSGAYFKTSSLNVTAWLSNGGIGSGQLLASAKPDDSVAEAGYYGYKFNVSVSPSDGDFDTGIRTLTLYEVTTGYYEPYDYNLESVNITFAKANTTAATTSKRTLSR